MVETSWVQVDPIARKKEQFFFLKKKERENSGKNSQFTQSKARTRKHGLCEK